MFWWYAVGDSNRGGRDWLWTNYPTDTEPPSGYCNQVKRAQQRFPPLFLAGTPVRSPGLRQPALTAVQGAGSEMLGCLSGSRPSHET